MQIIDHRTFHLVKGTGAQEVKRFQLRTFEYDGYLGRELFLNTEDKEMDILIVQMRWENKDKLMAFKKSDQHIEGHKNRKPNPNVLNHSVKIFTVE